jgi:hypothetical protein
MKKRIKSQSVKVIVDEHGQQHEYVEDKVMTWEIKPEHFYMTFLKIATASRLTGVEQTVMAMLCTRAKFDEGYVDVSRAVKEEMLEEADIKDSHFNNVTSSLSKKGFIRKEKGRYHINPDYYWKGTIEACQLLRAKNIELGVKFEVKLK